MWPYYYTNCTNPDLNGCGCQTCVTYPSNTIQYIGPNLPCSTINNLDTLTVALQKIETKICSLTPNYKIYRAVLYQEENAVPTVSELENNLGGTPVFSIISSGVFLMTLVGAFPTSKTFITVSSSINKFFKLHNGDADTIDFTVVNSSGANSPGFNALYLEIIVYI